MKTRYFLVFTVDGETSAVQITEQLEQCAVDLKVSRPYVYNKLNKQMPQKNAQ